MDPRALFVGGDGTVRAFWRVLFFFGATVVGLTVIIAVVYPIAALLGLPDFARATRLPVPDLMTVGALLIGTYAASRVVDGIRDGIWTRVGLGIRALRWRPIAIGLTVGTLAILLPSAALIATGRCTVGTQPQLQSWANASGVALIVLIFPALAEELAMRGYLLTTLRASAGTPAAIAITSVMFALLHLGNPDPTVVGIAMVGLAGYFLAVVRIATGSLYAAWMAHLAWNFAQAALLHAPVSGMPLPQPGYRLVDQGPAWLTGGSWGPEGGIAAAVGMLVTIFLLNSVLKRRATGEAVAPLASISGELTNE
jgi:membrane protease YdiL (CAAX protease family)